MWKYFSTSVSSFSPLLDNWISDKAKRAKAQSIQMTFDCDDHLCSGTLVLNKIGAGKKKFFWMEQLKKKEEAKIIKSINFTKLL